MLVRREKLLLSNVHEKHVFRHPVSSVFALSQPPTGISSETILKHSDISEEELLDLIDKLNTDHRVDGLLVQLPLPGKQTLQ